MFGRRRTRPAAVCEPTAVVEAREEIIETLRRISAEHPCDHPQCAEERADIGNRIARLDALTGDA